MFEGYGLLRRSIMSDCFQNGFRRMTTTFHTSINSIPNKSLFLHACSTSLLKILWDKEKLLVTCNFSFSHSVSYLFLELSVIFMKFEIVVCKLFQFGRVRNFLFGKGLRMAGFKSNHHKGHQNSGLCGKGLMSKKDCHLGKGSPQTTSFRLFQIQRVCRQQFQI